ncbi:MAG: VanW family protein [Clostridia bacterium]|nr:VanW family protein [Clostridia bacterium]
MKKVAFIFSVIFAVALILFSFSFYAEPVFAYNFQNVPLVHDTDNEKNTQSDFVLRAKFSTKFATSSPNRKHNIKLAASKLNVKLFPDEIFSFNKTVGARSLERGFLPAHIILDGEFVDGVGGGVCQVSTTLYNCALLADLEILFVRRHSLAVSYVPSSFDAMVSSGSDFVFTNSTASPIIIKAIATDDELTIYIYGDIMTRKLVARSVVTKTLPYVVEEIEDNTMPEGEKQTISRGKNGLRSVGYIDIYENGNLIGSQLIRKDIYKSQKRIVAIGTKSLDTEPQAVN